MARTSRRRSSQPSKTTKSKSKYAKVSKAEVFGDVNYFNRAGRYLILVNSIEEGENHNNILYVQNNMTVLHVAATGPRSYNYDKRKGGDPVEMAPHNVGEEVVDKIMSNNIVFGSNLKRLAMTIGDLTQEDFDNEEYEGQIIEEMVSEKQPLAGRVIEVIAKQIVKKPKRDVDEEDLTNDDVYTRVDYVELLQGDEIIEELDAEIIEKFGIDTSDSDEDDDAEATTTEDD